MKSILKTPKTVTKMKFTEDDVDPELVAEAVNLIADCLREKGIPIKEGVVAMVELISRVSSRIPSTKVKVHEGGKKD